MSIKNLLEELQRDYLKSMPGKILRIETLWETKKMEELETEFHKMKGTGKTYGLAEVTQLGAALERLCETQRDSLGVAVPLSLVVLERIRVSRNSGQAYKLEDDRDFRVIVELVVASGQTL